MEQTELTARPVIGIPRAMLYDRCRHLWRAFFAELGVSVLVSEPTSKKTVDDGTALAIDEACLSLKIFLGHVKALEGKCDYILIPRVANHGRGRDLCTRFAALYDLTKNVFRDSKQKFLSYSVDEMLKQSEAAAFEALGRELGFPAKQARQAYAAAKKTADDQYRRRVAAEEQLYRSDKLKILIAGHSYVMVDAYIGRTVADFLRDSGAEPIRADLVDRPTALRRSAELSATCRWEFSREILGSLAMHKDKVDGVIFLSAFPCGPDSMVNELAARRLGQIPILNLTLDGQEGTAGVETRLESFLDIIRFKKGTL